MDVCVCADVCMRGLETGGGGYISDSHSDSTLKDTPSLTPTPKPQQLDRDAPALRRPRESGLALINRLFLYTFRGETPVFLKWFRRRDSRAPFLWITAKVADARRRSASGERAHPTSGCGERRTRADNHPPPLPPPHTAGLIDPRRQMSSAVLLTWARLLMTRTLCQSSGDFLH